MSSNSILSRLFDRIGILPELHVKLASQYGIDSLETLLLQVDEFLETGDRLGGYRDYIPAVVKYLHESVTRLRDDGDGAGPKLEDIVENLVALKDEADGSWEDFLHGTYEDRCLNYNENEALKEPPAILHLKRNLPGKPEKNLSKKLKTGLSKGGVTMIVTDKLWKYGNGVEQLERVFAHKDPDWDFREQTGRREVVLTKLDIAIPLKAFANLYPHQRDGVKWILERYVDKSFSGGEKIGGILADEMGLGKTRQVLVALFALMGDKVGLKRGLVTCPPTLIQNWLDEAEKILPEFPALRNLTVVSSKDFSNATQRREGIRLARQEAKKAGTPLLAIVSSFLLGDEEKLSPIHSKAACGTWEFLAKDEVHLFKNPDGKVHKHLRVLCRYKSTFSVLLTATPMENAHEDFYNIVTLATSSKVLGNRKEYFKKYGRVLKAGRVKNAWAYDQARANFQQDIKPYIIQRKVKDHLKELKPKTELAVVIKASARQREMYGKVLRGISEEKVHPFNALTKLELIDFHPLFAELDEHTMKEIRQEKCGDDDEDDESDIDDENDNDDEDSNSKGKASKIGKTKRDEIQEFLQTCDVKALLRGSPMLQSCRDLAVKEVGDGNKTLICCDYLMPLDVLYHVLIASEGGLDEEQICRLDGSVKIPERRKRIESFQDTRSPYKVMLLTKKVGAHGLNLQAANRVIIWGVHWNPCLDMQMVGRSHRCGQTRKVIAYRLFVEGMVTEKMYWRQVHKEGMIRDTCTEAHSVESYFNKKELNAFTNIGSAPQDIQESVLLSKIGKKCHVTGKRNSFLLEHPSIKYLLDHDRIYCDNVLHAFRGKGGDGNEWTERRYLKKTPFVSSSEESLDDGNMPDVDKDVEDSDRDDDSENEFA